MTDKMMVSTDKATKRIKFPERERERKVRMSSGERQKKHSQQAGLSDHTDSETPEKRRGFPSMQRKCRQAAALKQMTYVQHMDLSISS